MSILVSVTSYSTVPLIQYALQEFKNIFGVVGEEVLSSNVIESESELLQGTHPPANQV